MKQAKTLVLALLAAAGIGAAFFQILPRTAARLNVLLIVADTLRADHLGSYGYPKDTSPQLDRLAGSGIVFENALAQGPWTKPSMGSLFTSTYPHNHSAMSNLFEILPGEARTLAEALKDHGYHTMAIQTNPSLSKPFHFDQGFDRYEELATGDPKDALVLHRAEEVVDRFFAWVDSDGKEPFFSYLHFMDSHLPFYPPQDHRLLFESSYEGAMLSDRITYEQLSAIQENSPRISETDRNHIVSLYDASIHYLDSQIGRLVDGLSERGLLNKTLIVLVSDHGEEFFEHGGFDHGQSLYEELLHVPFILWRPGMREGGSRIRQVVRLIDVFPTILSFARVAPPPGLLGENLAPLLSGPETDRKMAAYAEGVSFHKARPGRSPKDFVSVRKEGYKLIRQTIDGKRALEFYDLLTDPKELSPLADHPLIGEYESLLDTYQVLGQNLHGSEIKGGADSGIMKKLKSLGYLN